MGIRIWDTRDLLTMLIYIKKKKKKWMPQPRVTWVALPGKKMVIEDDDQKPMYMMETRALYNYQRNKE
jgi:hypothetical protein